MSHLFGNVMEHFLFFRSVADLMVCIGVCFMNVQHASMMNSLIHMEGSFRSKT
jgi:hypothetical protein